MLLQKLIAFDSLDTLNSEGLKRKLYNFFFNWQREAGDDSGNIKVNDYESEYKTNYNDDAEEKKKRL
jgi:hypothetical protein